MISDNKEQVSNYKKEGVKIIFITIFPCIIRNAMLFDKNIQLNVSIRQEQSQIYLSFAKQKKRLMKMNHIIEQNNP
jgi:hypothetical protein